MNRQTYTIGKRAVLNQYGKRIKKYWQVYVLMAGGILFYLIFKVKPIWGLGVAFVNFNIKKGLWGSEFVGLKYFKEFVANPNFLSIMRNTIAISVMNLAFAFPAPIIMSLLLNEIPLGKFKRITQSMIYLPHFMSWAVIAGLTFALFSTDIGVVNKLFIRMGVNTVPFLTTKRYFWWVLLAQTIWKETGWGTIVYLAAISQIDQGLYEAAIVDGANRWQMVLHITLPCIAPTIIVMFIMQIGKMFNINFDQVWMMKNDMVSTVAETFETYAFRVGVQMGNYSVGTAVGLMKSVVSFILVMLSNWGIKKTGHEGLF